MANSYEKLFESIQISEVSDNLLDSILEKIAINKKLRAQKRFIFSISAFTVSLMAFWPAIRYFTNEISQSGFIKYISLIFSDGEIILGYWQNFSLLILESLPILALISILAVIWTLFVSLRQIMSSFKVAFFKLN